MTGAYLRVKRRDKWKNIEVEHLTDDERREIFKNRDINEIIKWLNCVCRNLSKAERLFENLSIEYIGEIEQ